jgi:MoxR-like ATPase
MNVQDCRTCPSYTTDFETQRGQWGKVIGAPMCMRFNYMLGLGTNDTHGLDADHVARHNEEVAIHFGSDCAEHGVPLPTDTRQFVGTVSVSIGHQEYPPAGAAVLPTCNACSNCATASLTGETLGTPVSLCTAKGHLIFDPASEANGCDRACSGAPIRNSSDISSTFHFNPMFQLGFRARADIKMAALMENGRIRDTPLDYVTDKPVTDEERAEGIIAWREITDPEGSGNSVYLPIFTPEVFTVGEQKLIPQAGDNEHPELYVDYSGLLYQYAVDGYTLGEAFCLVGEPGLGKTEFGRWLAYLKQVPFNRFPFTKATEIDDMVGKTLFSPERGTYWHDGRVTEAYRSQAGIIMLDELNLGPEETREMLRPMIDNSSQLVLDSGLGVSVSRGKHSRILISMNPAWDVRNLGTSELADAETNRMSFAFVGYPPEEVEEQILRERCALDGYEIPEDKLQAIIMIGKEIREAAAQHTFPGSWGIRQQIKVARKTRFYNLTRAYRQANLNYLDPDEATLVLDIISTYGVQ